MTASYSRIFLLDIGMISEWFSNLLLRKPRDKIKSFCVTCSLSPSLLSFSCFSLLFLFSFLPLYTISMTVLGFSRNRTNRIYVYIYISYIHHIYVYMHIYIYIERIIMQNWLTLLWRPRSPTICLLQAGDPGNLRV